MDDSTTPSNPTALIHPHSLLLHSSHRPSPHFSLTPATVLPMSISSAAALSSTSRSLAFLPHLCATATDTTLVTNSSSLNFPYFCRRPHKKLSFCAPPKVSLSDGTPVTQESTLPPEADDLIAARRSADWKTARLYKERGLIYDGRVQAFNAGGLLVRFHSLLGFLPFRELSGSRSCREPQKSITEIARTLIGSFVSIKVLQVDEENKKLIFSEKEALWSRYSHLINVGDIFEAMVGSVEDYGAFVYLRFPDGCYHLPGLIHVSEVSWDYVHHARDVLHAGEIVKVKILTIDRAKSRITLSMRQLENDPLYETLEKVIPQTGSVVPFTDESLGFIEPLPGLESIIEELLQEDGIREVKITRQGFEKRVVSPDLQLWLANAQSIGDQFTLLARAGRQVQEIQLATSLDQDGIKKALQRVLERVP